jgi:hypothetical protein
MKKTNILSMVFLFLLAGAALYAVQYNSDGTVSLENRNGKEKKFAMDGKTVYGEPIRERRTMLRHRKFYVEVIYSPMFSDMRLTGDGKTNYMERFYKELARQVDLWLQKSNWSKGSMKIVVSNCRFSKTGFCGRKNKNEVRIYTYKDGEKGPEVSIDHKDLYSEENTVEVTKETVRKVMEKMR